VEGGTVKTFELRQAELGARMQASAVQRHRLERELKRLRFRENQRLGEALRDGWSMREAADALGLAKSTVMDRVRRGVVTRKAE
jgi:DNA-directed RNA polymerase specialized sigma24 family protein